MHVIENGEKNGRSSSLSVRKGLKIANSLVMVTVR